MTEDTRTELANEAAARTWFEDHPDGSWDSAPAVEQQHYRDDANAAVPARIGGAA